MMKAFWIYAGSVAAFALAIGAATPVSEAQTPRAGSCTGAHYHDFDFWLGKWKVRGPKGKVAGTNEITREQGGCVLQEHWTSKTETGTSFNIYDAASGRWHQTWVDSQGLLLLLDGGLRGNDMVLMGSLPHATHKQTLQRITWTPLPDGRVRQHWQTSSDNGKCWTDVFDGYYAHEK